MSLLEKQLEEISEADLHFLIESEVVENRTIEYKRGIPGRKDADKKELLADVSSFVNSAGGDIIFGVEAKSGIPISLGGIGRGEIDDFKLWIENVLRSGLDPKLPPAAIALEDISLESGKSCLIVRLRKSWLGPHAVSFKGSLRFFSRNSAGKIPLDVLEIRNLMITPEVTSEKVRRFLAERVSLIIAEENPVSLKESAKVILHIIPLESYNQTKVIDLSFVEGKWDKIRPICAGIDDFRYNFDGILIYTRDLDGTHGYVQFFHNGCVEAVDSKLLRPSTPGPRIRINELEVETLDALRRYLLIQQELGLQPPIFVCLSLVNVLGYKMEIKPGQGASSRSEAIDRDILKMPEAMITSFEESPEAILRPIFDSIWNAGGWPRSLNYTKKGERIEYQ